MKTKEEMVEELVETWTEAMDLDDLVGFFSDIQRTHLEAMSEEEVTETYKENFNETDEEE